MGKTRTDGAERNLGQDDLSEYLRAKEPGKAELAGIWRAAIGLQKVDGLTPSAYLVETARRNIEGEITIAEAGKIIGEYYKSKAVRAEAAKTRTDEADIVSQRITEILAEPTFSFSPEQLVSIHRRLFDGIFKHAGTIRDYNITKNEWVLKGDTVQYASCFRLVETMAFDFSEEKKFSYAAVSMDEVIRHFSKFIAGIWQIHPFGEGNTRTTSTFAMKYLRTLGFDVDNDIFYALLGLMLTTTSSMTTHTIFAMPWFEPTTPTFPRALKRQPSTLNGSSVTRSWARKTSFKADFCL